jgi:hypothetical protein
MTTSYSLSDSLPKDGGGAKFAGWVDLATSQLDLSLPGGIGSKTTGSKITSALWSGNGLAGCKVEPTGGVGNVLMAHFASNASPTAAQNGIHLRADDRGALMVTGLSATTCAILATSRSTISTASGLVYKMIIAGCGVLAGAQLAVLNGTASLAHVVFGAANETLPVVDFGTGACFSSLIVEKRGTVGDVFVTSNYRGYGQG